MGILRGHDFLLIVRDGVSRCNPAWAACSLAPEFRPAWNSAVDSVWWDLLQYWVLLPLPVATDPRCRQVSKGLADI